MQLILDFGNSRTKAGIFSGHELLSVQTRKSFSNAELKKLLKAGSITKGMSCSVTRNSKLAERFLAGQIPFETLRPSTKVAVKNCYQTPRTLGMDRLAALVGACSFFPGKNILVISAGTCITYDLINSRREYFGGNITPGLEMRLKAMHTFTSKLPLVKKQFTAELIGASTSSAMLTGAVTGAFLEMIGFIEAHQKKHRSLVVVITGGDASLLFPRFSARRHKKEYKIFARPHLVLHGLNEILLANNASNP